MACALELLVASKSIPMSFERSVRAQKAKVAQKARAKRIQDCDDNDADRRSDFCKLEHNSMQLIHVQATYNIIP